ncbi:hypothetical protein [Falsigemmobacter faecalis]|uniref:Uncharacterized protein n=1 Tax=Falsigemmobacter faecalis TaxID=2488730 RepID=A0A3P3D9Q2_9RHOB|nr:hypothetical protein [Falsigemmobacter faecalis]RRH71083.1 hypothetical protein EG244_16935 [Falsigemmobacter faecalis]
MKFLTMALVMTLLPLTAQAQVPISGDLTVSLNPQRYRICNDRPERLAWMETIVPREAYRAVTLMELYELRSWETIVRSQDCSCATRFPPWTNAGNEYDKTIRLLSAAEHTRKQRELRRQAAQLRSAVETVCRAQGNW